jgi:hypothetical protein
MQLLYGRSTVNNTGQRVIQYFSRNQITTREEMAEVINVRVALLVSTVQEARPGDNTETSFDLLGTTVSASPPDRRLRKVFTTTVQLRNRCQALPITIGSTSTICF